MKEEGVSVLRSRFGFTRTTVASNVRPGGAIHDSSPRTDRRQQLFLKKLEYFNSNSTQDTNKQNCNTDSRVIVKNSINRAKENYNYNANEVKSDRNKSLTKTLTKVSQKVSTVKNDPVQGSQSKKPLFVTKYSPYRGDTRKQSAPAPLIMTAENGQLSQKNDPKLQRSNVYTKPSSSTSAMQKPSQLPGLRASFLNSENNRLTSASLHSRSYGYQDQDTSRATKDQRPENNKTKLRKFVSYKNKAPTIADPTTSSCGQKVDVAPKSRPWLAKKTEEKGLSELECLTKLRLSNKIMLEQPSVSRTRVAEPSLPTIPQDTELCEDCNGETEEDSGIFTSSHSKYSLEDEMIESDDSPREVASKDVKNFSSDSDDMCSRETSPMQLLADLLRRPAEHNVDQTDGKSSLVKRRKQQFEQDFGKLQITETKRSFLDPGKLQSDIDFQKISNLPDVVSRTSQSCDKQTEKCPVKESSENVDFSCSRMESSMVSNTSRLSVCTDCTGSSEDNENKFFDDDYNDQQQLILNSEPDQTTYEENLFDAVDCLLQGEKLKADINSDDSKVKCEVDEMKTAGQVQVARVKQIMEEESVRNRKVSVDTLSSLESDVCMLDLDDGFPLPEDSPDDSRTNSPVSRPGSDLILSDVVSIRKLMLQLQGLLSQSEASTKGKMEEENSDLKRELSLLRLKLAERDRKIETLERQLQYSQSHSLSKLNNIATQTPSSVRAKPRPLSWDLTSISLVRNINNL